MDAKDVIRANLKACLSESGKSQTELANALGVTPSAVSNWIHGKNNIDIEYVPEICRFLGIPIARLFEENTRDVSEITYMIVNLDDKSIDDVRDYIEFKYRQGGTK